MKINRARSQMMVCFYTLPLYVLALFMLLNDGHQITNLMFVYMGVYAIFAINMAARICPQCRDQFFVKGFWLSFFTRKCVHCGLILRRRGDPADASHEKMF